MKTRLFALICAIVMILSLCACGDDAPAAVVSGGDVSASDVSATDLDWYAALTDEERLLADVVLSSTDAFNAEDEAAYMATIDPESDALEETLEYVRLVFGKYSLTATIEEIKVISVKDDSAELRVTQTTVRNGEGKAFADARTVMLHTLVCRDGVWYISSTVVESRTELKSNWGELSDYLEDEDVSGTDAAAV